MSVPNTDERLSHHFSDGLYAKEIHIPEGHYILQHKHVYSHLSVLAKGFVAVEVDGETVEYEAPACINIKAGANHTISAIEDSVWFCIHATDEKNPDAVDRAVIGE